MGHPVPGGSALTDDAMDDRRGMLDGPTCERSVWWAWRDFTFDDELFYLDMEEQGILIRPSRPPARPASPSHSPASRRTSDRDQHQAGGSGRRMRGRPAAANRTPYA